MMHISASTAPIRVKQKPLYSQLNAECDKHYYNSLFKYLENPPESLMHNAVLAVGVKNAADKSFYGSLNDGNLSNDFNSGYKPATSYMTTYHK